MGAVAVPRRDTGHSRRWEPTCRKLSIIDEWLFDAASSILWSREVWTQVGGLRSLTQPGNGDLARKVCPGTSVVGEVWCCCSGASFPIGAFPDPGLKQGVSCWRKPLNRFWRRGTHWPQERVGTRALSEPSVRRTHHKAPSRPISHCEPGVRAAKDVCLRTMTKVRVMYSNIQVFISHLTAS